MKLFVTSFLLVLLTSIYNTTFSQKTDTIKSSHDENFFGSDCPRDTVEILIAKNDLCIFYAKQFKLSRVKENKIKWVLKLNKFQESDYICIVPLNRKLNKKGRYKNKKQVVCILGYRDDKEVKRQYVKLPSGKFL